MTTTEKMRICILAPSLDLLGGQSRQASRLIEGLRKEPSLDVCFIPHNPGLPSVLRWLQRIKYVRTLVTSLVYWATLVLRLGRYDIIHIFSASYYSYSLTVLPAILIAKIYGKKIVLNYRSGEAEDHFQRWRWTALPTIRRADVIVVPSGYLVDIFAKFGLRAHSIPNIVELDRFHFRKRIPLRPVFLTSRLLEPLYNVPCVLRAFSVIQRRISDASLTVAGDGWQRNELEELARELGLRNTKFIGRVPWDKMAELYDAADIYLTATDIDNMPSSVLECFASGLPVVTTDAGGVPYILRHEETGLMVRRGDHEALAASAIRLLENESLALAIADSAKKECHKYSWHQVRNEWLKLYRELISVADVSENKLVATDGEP
ncbi:MAG: glycosyltransferase family 4 protein [Nitrospiraceae bacterium]